MRDAILDSNPIMVGARGDHRCHQEETEDEYR
jgi:hypothetical protein